MLSGRPHDTQIFFFFSSPLPHSPFPLFALTSLCSLLQFLHFLPIFYLFLSSLVFPSAKYSFFRFSFSLSFLPSPFPFSFPFPLPGPRHHRLSPLRRVTSPRDSPLSGRYIVSYFSRLPHSGSHLSLRPFRWPLLVLFHIPPLLCSCKFL